MRVLMILVMVSCGGGDPDPVPSAPITNNAAYDLTTQGPYSLVADEVSPGNAELTFDLNINGASRIAVWTNDNQIFRRNVSSSTTNIKVPVADLEVGEHELLFVADGKTEAFAKYTIHRTKALYTLVSNDWDDANPTNQQLALQDELYAEHPFMRNTHFVGPYTFTDSTLTDARRGFLVNWLKQKQASRGDEIALHIHPYCNFVETTDVPCRHVPSTVRAEDATGYTVECAAYTQTEFETLLDKSDELFIEYGLEKPTSFRAGGWTADGSTLAALANKGYVADSSANNHARMEEWAGEGTLLARNQELWPGINDTSQPYFPSESEPWTTGPDALDILQVPDNGILCDYVTADEMIEIFGKNWSGGVLTEPKVFSVGYHPGSFIAPGFKERLTDALTHVDQFLARNHQGPVVYGTVSDMAKIWTK